MSKGRRRHETGGISKGRKRPPEPTELATKPTDEELGWATNIVLEEERRKRNNPRWVPTLLNGGNAFTYRVKVLIRRQRYEAQGGKQLLTGEER